MDERLRPSVNPIALEAFRADPVGCTLAGGERVPGNLIAEAQGIIAAHRPAGLPSGIDPQARLSDEDFSYIDHLEFRRKSIDEQRKHLAELRERYKGDREAEIQILRHDPQSEFYQKHQALFEAYRDDDDAKFAELKAWFDENYPGVEI